LSSIYSDIAEGRNTRGVRRRRLLQRIGEAHEQRNRESTPTYPYQQIPTEFHQEK
jgi:hypothetical protein